MNTGLPTLEVAGLRVAYREKGHGNALVLLHGFLCDSRCWRRQLDELSNEFRVIAWDAPGAGSSADPPEPFVTSSFARCLASFLDELHVERAHVLGLSWGGIVAQEFYRLYPERLRSLILAGTYAGWRGSLPEKDWKDRLTGCLVDASGPPEALVAKFLPSVFTDGAAPELRDEFSAIVAEFHPVGYRLMALSSVEMDTRELLPGIAVPTLVLWGDGDRRSPPHIAEQFYKAIPHAQLAVVSNAGHLSNMEQPEAFNAHVRRFCLAHNQA